MKGLLTAVVSFVDEGRAATGGLPEVSRARFIYGALTFVWTLGYMAYIFVRGMLCECIK